MKNDWYMFSSSQQFDIDEKKWTDDQGDLLNIHSPFHQRFLFRTNHEFQGLWKFHPQIPIFNPKNIISFGEGITPVVNEMVDNKNIIFKLEYLFPTGSFKDRGATVLLSKIKELGVEHIVEDSSGNAGCAIAAYATKAKITCDIFVSSKASPAKIKQIRGYGATVNLINGTREEVAEAAMEAAVNSYYASHSYNPFFFEGTKTFAYEVWEQCLELPEEIIFPVGNGTLIMGTYKGFLELKNAGLIQQFPALSIAQAKNCQSLAKTPVDLSQPTVAEGISSKNPVRRAQIQEILDKTGGNYYAIEENEILKSHQEMHKMGYFIELTSAVATAAIPYTSFKKVMIPLTGHGLKNS